MTEGTLAMHVRVLAWRTAVCLPGALLVLLLAGAGATPPEALYLKGVQDGGDYNSLIQPLVLALSGLADASARVLIPLRPGPARMTSPVPTDRPVSARAAAESRAPPAP